MKYKLIKTQRVGAPKAIYQVVDESGKVISQRVSARVYVACSINGDYYFGRMDLVGKGDYASMLQRVKNFLNGISRFRLLALSNTGHLLDLQQVQG